MYLTLESYEAAQGKERVEHCACCEREIYPDHPGYTGKFVDGLGYTCLTHYLEVVVAS